MRKFLVSLIAVAALGAGAAFAQGGSWVGLSTGYPFGVTLHYGMEDLFSPGMDLRLNLRGDFGGGTLTGGVTYSVFSVSVGGDLLYGLADLSTDPNLNPYVGGGLTLGFAGGSTSDGVSIGGLAYDIHGLAGAEYLVASSFGIFGEVQLGFGQAAAAAVVGGTTVSQAVSGLTYALRLGVNYHF